MAKESDSKLFAFLGVFLTILGFVIVLLAKKEDKYAMYYAKQGLVLGIAWIIAWVIMMILAFIPILGWIVDILLWLFLVILWIMGIVYALSGKEKPLPVIGVYAEKINI